MTRTPIFFAYKIKSNYFMTKQVVWTFRKLFFLQFDTKFASKQQRLAKIGLALHELDFFLYFSLENSILSCVTVGLQHICST